MIKTIVFDIGNVVWRYRPLQTKLFHQWADLMNISVHQFRLNFFEKDNFYRKFELNTYNLTDWFSDIAPTVNPQKFIACLDLTYSDHNSFSLYLNQSVVKLVSQLRSQNILVGCLSNTENYFYPYFKNNFIPLFDYSITSWEVGYRKPDPQIYHQIFKYGKFLPSEIIFIDDVPINVAGANKLGINGLLFQNITKLKKDISSFDVSF